jgi:hypothetical protein
MLMEYADRGTLADIIWPKPPSGARAQRRRPVQEQKYT